MAGAPAPLNEAERLAALRAFEVLDTAPEKCSDDLTRLAATVAGTPIAPISLVDESRQWFKARVGLAASETPREQSFCAWCVYDVDALIVRDAHLDGRFSENPLVTGEPGIRFYAGMPLMAADDVCLGSLCVIDTVPRDLSDSVLEQLRLLANVVVEHLQARKTAAELADALARVEVLGKFLPVCAYCKKLREDDEYKRSLERWLHDQAGTQITHGICPPCAAELMDEDGP